MQLLLLAIFALALAVTSSSSKLIQSAKRNLVPTRRFAGLEARDLWRNNIVPHSDIQLNYGLAAHHPPTAYVSCTAHDDHPILLLEDIDHLFDDVRCSSARLDDDEPATMDLVFSSQDAFIEALEIWTGLQAFIIVSSHSGCNADDERAAWRVQSVWGDLSHFIVRLSVQSTPLHLLGQACHIQYSHMASGTSGAHDVPRLYTRDADEFTGVHSVGYDQSDLGSRFPLWPLTNDTLIAAALQQEMDNLDLQLTCVDCSFKSNFSLAFDIEYTVGNVSCLDTNASCFSLNKVGFNVTVIEFDQSANLEVAVGDDFKFSANWTIFPFLDVPQLNFDGITVGPAAGVQIGFDLDIPVSFNFTYGAQASIPSGTFASFDLLDASGNFNPSLNAEGWNQINVTQIPFRVNSGQFNITANVWLAPFAEIDFEIESFGASAEILAHTPMIIVDADLLSNVNRNCSPIGPEDFETFGVAFAVGADLEIGPAAQFDINSGDLGDILNSLNFSTSYEQDFPDFTFDKPLFPTNGTNDPKCFVLSNDIQSAAPAPASASAQVAAASPSAVTLQGVPAATGTMFAAASAVPTWDFQKIESYSSANGHLPTNVNYQQMLQATTVPAQLLNAIKAVSGAQRLALCPVWYLYPVAALLGFVTSL